VFCSCAKIYMPGVKMVPGNYRVDEAEWEFAKCMETGQCYAVNDTVIDWTTSYSGLNQLLMRRHPAKTSSGRPRGFSAKSKIRFLGVLLGVWEGRGKNHPFSSCNFNLIYFCAGFGKEDGSMPHDIPKLTPEQIAIAGPQPESYPQCEDIVSRKQKRASSEDVSRQLRPRLAGKPAAETRKSSLFGEQLVSSVGSGKSSLYATGGKKLASSVNRLASGKSFVPSRKLVPRNHKDDVLFDAPFTDNRYLLVSGSESRGQELRGVVDDLYDAYVMSNPEDGIRMLQRWLRALHEGGDRAISRIREDWGEPPLAEGVPPSSSLAKVRASSEKPSYPKGVWPIPSSLRKQVRRDFSYQSKEVQDKVALILKKEDENEKQALQQGLRPVFKSVSQILKEAGGKMDDSSDSDSPPVKYSPASPSHSPPPA
jgi:hypothetical protein